MSKKALLVGINNFIRPSWKLRGCVNDTLAMQAMLTSYFGFADESIKVMHDRDATAQGIREGLAWLLRDYEGEGKDVRVFHFSSHGTQVEDQGEDEWEGKDEVIVPYDHDWDTPFRDDDLREIFQEIPKDVNFTFIADCCHSGSIQRKLQESDIDFTPRYLTPPDEVEKRIAALKEKRDQLCDEYVSEKLPLMLQGVSPGEWTIKMKEFIPRLREEFRAQKYGNVSVAKDVLLAACEDVQTAADAYLEGDYRGAFTWAITKAMKEAHGNLTYGELITQAAANLQRFEQRPQLECPLEMRELRVFVPLAEMQPEPVPV